MKLAAPRILPQLSLGSLESLMEGELDEVHLFDVDATKLNSPALVIDGSVVEKTHFLQAQLLRLGAKDMRVKQSDFSSAALTDANINRAEFITCRMTGVDLSKATLHDVVFKGCKLDLANFRFTDLRRVHFIDCTLVETDFLGASLSDVVFQSCVLEKVNFNQIHCKQLDLRSSQLTEVSGWGSMKGAIIDSTQLVEIAPYLAYEAGLIIK
jgi:uncharacterized protein YjbI with pentapeptide repeats